MNWTLLNDPLRQPVHWLEIIQSGQYAVFILDIRTRTPRNEDGSIPAEGQSGTALCDDLAGAQSFARAVLARHPELVCEIYDHSGKSGEAIDIVYDPSVAGRHQGRPVARRETIWGSIVVTCAAVILSIDIRHGFTWIWGYVIGLKMLVIGVSLLIRGISGLYEPRK